MSRTPIPACPLKADDPRSLMRATRCLFCSLTLLVLVGQLAFAQGAASGDLHISVQDQKGDSVANATVTVRDPEKGVERTGTGDGQGGYSVHLLPPGTYSVRIEAPGFAKTDVAGVSITVGGQAEL